MADFKTPGVYVEEITTLPPSVGQVPTAVPAFIGYTSKAEKNGQSLTHVPTHVTSMLEYVQYFGGGYDAESIEVELDKNNQVDGVSPSDSFYMYDSLRMFFANGGGECYIVSVGSYEDDVSMDALINGVAACKREDHPTILITPDAMLLEKPDEAYSVQQSMLSQCAELQDRVAVLDIHRGFVDRRDEDVVLDFRNGIGVNHLKYAAAYYPWVLTTLSHHFSYEVLTVKKEGDEVELDTLVQNPQSIKNLNNTVVDVKNVRAFTQNPLEGDTSWMNVYEGVSDDDHGTNAEVTHYVETLGSVLKAINEFCKSDFSNPTVANELRIKTNATSAFASTVKAIAAIDKAVGTDALAAGDFENLDLESVAPIKSIEGLEEESVKVKAARNQLNSQADAVGDILRSLLSDAESVRDNVDKIAYDVNPLYQNIVNEVNRELAKLPVAGAIAGVYAMVDNTRGVWKAPANVSLSSVSRPTIKIDHKQQEDLNVDVVAGKSVNAIRPFTGKGTLVWGARTLAGNDNEWRYISVRRFFNMVETSVRQSTSWAVFEPNDASTWIRVKAMIDNFLTNLWNQGALAGASPADAFFVNVGLGTTMSQTDILEGRMNVEIGMAAVRPAEFIVLKFSHKMQES